MASVPPDRHLTGAFGRRDTLISGNLLAVGSMVLWAAGFPAAELLLDVWHPITLMALRTGMALAVLLPLWLMIDGLRTVRAANWRAGFWIGFFGFGAGVNLLLFAQWYTDPLTVALIATTTPVTATLIELLNRQRKLSPRFVVGLIASVLGGAVAVGGNISPDLGWGVLMAVASGVCFVWASNRTVVDFPDLTPLGRCTITFVGAGAFTGLIFLFGLHGGWITLPTRITPAELGLLSVYSVAAMALSQILFIASVGRLGIALSSFHINVAPFYVMLILIVLGGTLDWRAILGAAIVGIGVVLSQDRV